MKKTCQEFSLLEIGIKNLKGFPIIIKPNIPGLLLSTSKNNKECTIMS